MLKVRNSRERVPTSPLAGKADEEGRLYREWKENCEIIEECEVWSVKCGVRSVECEVRSVKCGVRSVKCIWHNFLTPLLLNFSKNANLCKDSRFFCVKFVKYGIIPKNL